MKTIDEAVDRYLPLKLGRQMSISEIRDELKQEKIFSDAQIKVICMRISDAELEHMGESKKNPFAVDFMNTIGFSIFMILASIAIFIFSFIKFDELMKASEAGAKVQDIHFFAPGAFMIASAMFLVRHVVKIIRRNKR